MNNTKTKSKLFWVKSDSLVIDKISDRPWADGTRISVEITRKEDVWVPDVEPELAVFEVCVRCTSILDMPHFEREETTSCTVELSEWIKDGKLERRDSNIKICCDSATDSLSEFFEKKAGLTSRDFHGWVLDEIIDACESLMGDEMNSTKTTTDGT